MFLLAPLSGRFVDHNLWNLGKILMKNKEFWRRIGTENFMLKKKFKFSAKILS